MIPGKEVLVTGKTFVILVVHIVDYPVYVTSPKSDKEQYQIQKVSMKCHEKLCSSSREKCGMNVIFSIQSIIFPPVSTSMMSFHAMKLSADANKMFPQSIDIIKFVWILLWPEKERNISRIPLALHFKATKNIKSLNLLFVWNGKKFATLRIQTR